MDENYGVDPESSSVTTEDHGVHVPESRIKFFDTDIVALKEAIHPLGVSDNYGLDIYEHTLQYISTLTPQ